MTVTVSVVDDVRKTYQTSVLSEVPLFAAPPVRAVALNVPTVTDETVVVPATAVLMTTKTLAR